MAIYMTIMKQSNNLSASPLPVPNRTPKYTTADSIALYKMESPEERNRATQQPFHASYFGEAEFDSTVHQPLNDSVIWQLFGKYSTLAVLMQR